jgi:hypothetical protein
VLSLIGLTATATAAAERVVIGAYINDIQAVDLQTHSYRIDAYIWFRWKNPAMDVGKTMEFMNTYNPDDLVRTDVFSRKAQPDGSLYSQLRVQSQFSVKFPLQRYPFDQQRLVIEIEDTESGSSDLVFVPDSVPVTLNSGIQLPGFKLGQSSLEVVEYPYPTTFGDLAEPNVAAYSRARIVIPVGRPPLAGAIKIFLPLLLIVLCTALVYFVHPSFVEGRLGVGITGLLTLVALQLTTSSSLPEVDYLLMVDKIYILSYLFIVLTLAQVVRTSKRIHAGEVAAIVQSDRRAMWMLVTCYVVGAILTVALTLLR